MAGTDVIVLGAGMVGVSTALHLQKRGKCVVLIDRRGAGEETSYGNTGIIQREGVVPYPFPRDVPLLLRYALNRLPESRLDWRALIRYGVIFFILEKLAAAVGTTNQHIYAHMRGESPPHRWGRVVPEGEDLVTIWWLNARRR